MNLLKHIEMISGRFHHACKQSKQSDERSERECVPPTKFGFDHFVLLVPGMIETWLQLVAQSDTISVTKNEYANTRRRIEFIRLLVAPPTQIARLDASRSSAARELHCRNDP
jgi:hypothetical protein